MSSAVRDFGATPGWWRGRLLEVLPTAAYVCDADGFILDYNQQASTLWGRSPTIGERPERYCGSYRLYLPDGSPLPHSLCPMADVIEQGVSVRNQEVIIERPSGDRIVVLVNIDPLRDDTGAMIGAINCFSDVTERKRTEQQLRASQQDLEDFFERELLHALPAAVYTTDAEGRITFYNEAAAQFWGHRPPLGESKWCGSWRLYRLDGSVLPHDECPMALALTAGRSIRNVEAIAERPDGTRIHFTPYPTPLRNSAGEIVGAVNMLIDVNHIKEAERRQRMLINELNHRVKNTLATVQSLAHQTFHGGEACEAFESRLFALAKTHDVLTKESWVGADLREIVTGAVAFVPGAEQRIHIEGRDVRLLPHSTVPLAMGLHELCTNAAKYGSLSRANGKVRLSWQVADGRVLLRWIESGGPPVRPPTRKGFGSRLLERGLVHELEGEVRLTYPAAGVTYEVEFPLER